MYAPCVQPVPNNVCTDLLESGQCLILGHHTSHKAGVAASIGA